VETTSDGATTANSETFGNFETAKSRLKGNVPPTVDSPQDGNVRIGPWPGSGPKPGE
jgi:hypothetical protein